MMFLSFTLNQPNFMILDEPTNHIDLVGKQQLTKQLMQSGASLLITNHDRYFLEQIVTRWIWINNDQMIEVGDNESFYLSLSKNDRNRKSKFQKPMLQLEWQKEIDALWEKLTL